MLIHLLALSALYHSYILAYLHDHPLKWCALVVTVCAGYFTLRSVKVIALFGIASLLPPIVHLITLEDAPHFPYDRHVVNVDLLVLEDSHLRSWGVRTLVAVREVTQCHELNQQSCSALVGKKLLLNDRSGTVLLDGQKVKGSLALKPPLGFINPGGFDYEHWLFAQGIYAKGYFVDPPLIEASHVNRGWAATLNRTLSARGAHGEGAHSAFVSAERESAILKALLLGDRSGMQESDRQLLAESGLIHLFVISGLHIGLLFGVVFYLLKVLVIAINMALSVGLWRGGMTAGVDFCSGLAFLLVWWYVDQIGYPISATRALLFLAIWLMARVLKRELSLLQVLSLSVFLILSCWPYEMFSYGFWMSVLAVLGLSLALIRKPRVGLVPKESTYGVRFSGWLSAAQVLVKAQLFIFVLLCPLLLSFGTETSVLSFLWNLIFIPLFGLVVMPVLLMSGLLFPVFSSVALELAFFLSGMLVALLDAVGYANQFFPTVSFIQGTSEWWLYYLVAIILLLPLKRSVRLASTMLAGVLMVVTPKQSNDLEVWFLDVGQALSVVMVKDQHAFIYDAGFAFGDFNAADTVIIPFLRQREIKAVDVLAVSHQDLDHSGGMVPLLDSRWTPEILMQNFVEVDGFSGESRHCFKGQSFRWREVEVSVLWPPSKQSLESLSSNDSSCVILLEFKQQKVLLTGDITSQVEQALLRAYPDLFAQVIQVMSVPHHGSKSSSSRSFVDAVQPEWAVASAGPLNRFRHPHPDVTFRYQEIGATVINTAEMGALLFELDAERDSRFKLRIFERKIPYWRTRRVQE